MTELQLSAALEIGRERVVAAKQRGIELFIGGEMGIANTTAATALLCALLDCPAQALTGPGTGLDAAGVAHKRRVIERALEIHVDQLDTPMNILRCVGGFEIAALVGAYAACAELQLPMLIDGFIASSAAVVAQHLYPGVEEWMLCAHCSAEPGHQQALAALGKQGILDVGMRLGEGSGAAVCVPLLRMACALHNQMATFAEAAVSNKVAVGDDAETNTNADANSNTKSEID